MVGNCCRLTASNARWASMMDLCKLHDFVGYSQLTSREVIEGIAGIQSVPTPSIINRVGGIEVGASWLPRSAPCQVLIERFKLLRLCTSSTAP